MAGIRTWIRRLLRKLPPPLGDFAATQRLLSRTLRRIAITVAH